MLTVSLCCANVRSLPLLSRENSRSLQELRTSFLMSQVSLRLRRPCIWVPPSEVMQGETSEGVFSSYMWAL